MPDHDRLFKEILDNFFDEFVELFLPDIYSCVDLAGREFIGTELITDVVAGEVHRVDRLVCARARKDGSPVLIHVEAEANKPYGFGKRLFRYYARLREVHDLPVHSAVIFSFDSPKDEQPCEYREVFLDREVIRFRYRVIQLNCLDWRDFLAKDNPVAAAFMAKMKFGRTDRPLVKLECLKMIIRLRLNEAKTRLLTGFVDGYLEFLPHEEQEFRELIREMEGAPKEEVMEIITSWMKEGIEKGLVQGRAEGRQEGREEGREEGRYEASIALISRQAAKRFGSLAPSDLQSLKACSPESLESLAEELLDFDTIDDFRQWLAMHAPV